MAILELLLAFIARAVGCYGYHHWTIYTLLIETNPITSYIPVNVIGTAREKLWYEKKFIPLKATKTILRAMTQPLQTVQLMLK